MYVFVLTGFLRWVVEKSISFSACKHIDARNVITEPINFCIVSIISTIFFNVNGSRLLPFNLWSFRIQKLRFSWEEFFLSDIVAFELVDLYGIGRTDSQKICFVYSMSWPPKLAKLAIIYSRFRLLAICTRFKRQVYSKCV